MGDYFFSTEIQTHIEREIKIEKGRDFEFEANSLRGLTLHGSFVHLESLIKTKQEHANKGAMGIGQRERSELECFCLLSFVSILGFFFLLFFMKQTKWHRLRKVKVCVKT
ncbi:hypothetical protein V6Z11_A05G323700 [Gossypium hirsutum]